MGRCDEVCDGNGKEGPRQHPRTDGCNFKHGEIQMTPIETSLEKFDRQIAILSRLNKEEQTEEVTLLRLQAAVTANEAIQEINGWIQASEIIKKVRA
jgi:hypothetical protein